MVIVPFALLFAILLGSGAYLQHFAYELLEGGPPTLAEAAVGEPVNLLPSLPVWMSEFTYPPYLIIGLLTALISTRGSSPKYMSLFAGISFAILISLADLTEQLATSTFSVEGLVKNIIANVVGGGIAAVIVAASLCLYELIVSKFGSGLGYRALAATSVPALAFLISGSLYYLLYFFFQPAITRLEFTVVPPGQGFYSPTAAERPPGSDTSMTKNLSFMPAQVLDAFASADATEGAFNLDWEAQSKEQRFRAEVYLTSDCADLSQVQRLSKKRSQPYLNSDNLRLLRLKADNGISYIRLGSTTESGFSVELDGPTFFWIAKDSSSNKLETSVFFSPSDRLRRKTKGASDFFLNSVLLKSDEKHSRPFARSFFTNVGSGAHQVTFQAGRFINPKRKLRCKFVNAAASKNVVIPQPEAGFVAGVYVKIIPVEVPLSAYRTFDNELSLTGFGGRVGVGGMNPGEIDNKYLGSTNFLSVSTGLTSLKADNREIPVKREDSIYVLGHISAEREAQGLIRFTGAAKAAWKNGSRLSRSRWERLPTEWQLAVLGWIGGVLYGLSRLWSPLARRLRQNTPFLAS